MVEWTDEQLARLVADVESAFAGVDETPATYDLSVFGPRREPQPQARGSRPALTSVFFGPRGVDRRYSDGSRSFTEKPDPPDERKGPEL